MSGMSLNPDADIPIFLQWVNFYLRRRNLQLTELCSGFKDGVALVQLTEELTGNRFDGKYKPKPKMKIHMLENVNLVWPILRSLNLLREISKDNVVDGDQKAIPLLVWNMVRQFQLCTLWGQKYGQTDMLKWLNARLKRYATTPLEMEIHNLFATIKHGEALPTLINSLDPGIIDLAALPRDPKERNVLTMRAAHDMFEFPDILNSNDVTSVPGENAVMIYLSFLRRVSEHPRQFHVDYRKEEGWKTPAGALWMPDRSVRYPDGSVRAADGQHYLLPDKTQVTLETASPMKRPKVAVNEDGTFELQDETVIFPSGATTTPKGNLALEDGSLVRPAWLLPCYYFTRPMLVVPSEYLSGSFLDIPVPAPLNADFFVLPTGAVIHRDRTIFYPDGSVLLSDGSLCLGDSHRTILPRSFARNILPDTVLLADGTIQHADHVLEYPTAATNKVDCLVRLRFRGKKHSWPVPAVGPLAPFELPPSGWGLSQSDHEGNVSLPTGSKYLKNGDVLFPDGSVQLRDGTVRLTDGTVIGTVQPPDFSIKLADGSYQSIEDTEITFPSGTSTKQGQLLLKTDSRLQQPTWPISGPFQTELNSTYKWANYLPTTTLSARGVITGPDGKERYPDGSVREGFNYALPNGKITSIIACRKKLPASAKLHSDGTATLENGEVAYPSGVSSTASGDLMAGTDEFMKPKWLLPWKYDQYRPQFPDQWQGEPQSYDGKLMTKDGAILLPSGAVIRPNRRIYFPDGAIRHSDGTFELPDFCRTLLVPPVPITNGGSLLADGTILNSDGTTLTYPSGLRTVAGNAELVATDGAKSQPLWCVPPPGRPLNNPGFQLPSSGWGPLLPPTSDDPFILPHGAKFNPQDGTLIYPDGTAPILAEKQAPVEGKPGITVLPDRSIQYPDYSVRYPNGTRTLPNGKLLVMDERQAPPSWSITPPKESLTETYRWGPVMPTERGKLPRGLTRSGAWINPDGSIEYPDGSTCDAKGLFHLPNGQSKSRKQLQAEPGPPLQEDGTREIDGKFQYPSGAMSTNRGYIRDKDRDTGLRHPVFAIQRSDLPQPNQSLITYEPGHQFPDGSILLPTGAVMWPTGVIRYLDGSVRRADTTFELGDERGTIMTTLPNPDPSRRLLLADSSVVVKEGGLRFPSGAKLTTHQGNPTLLLQDGEAVDLPFRFRFDETTTNEGKFTLPEFGWSRVPFGAQFALLPSGSRIGLDGVIQYPDGTTRTPNGKLLRVDGKPAQEIPPPPCSIKLPDGSYQLGNEGEIQYPSGAVTTAEGQLVVGNKTSKPLWQLGDYGRPMIETFAWGPKLPSPGPPPLALGKTKNGAFVKADGTLLYPDGSSRNADGIYDLPDGQKLSAAARAQRIPPGGNLNQDGTATVGHVVQYPTGAMSTPARNLKYPDGSIHFPKFALPGTPEFGNPQVPKSWDGNFAEAQQVPKTVDGNLAEAPSGSEGTPKTILSLPDGSVLLPTGAILSADRSLRFPDGCLLLLNGALILPDEIRTIASPVNAVSEDVQQFPDGSVLTNEGLQYPSHSSLRADNHDILILPDGKSMRPLWKIPTCATKLLVEPDFPVLPESGWGTRNKFLPVRNGDTRLPTGAVCRPDESIAYPDGSLRFANGTLHFPDLVEAGRSIQRPHAAVALPDGCFQLGDAYEILYPSGAVLTAEGNLRTADGRLIDPEWDLTVPSFDLTTTFLWGSALPERSSIYTTDLQLHKAAARGDIALCGKLLDNGSLPNGRDPNFLTPMHGAKNYETVVCLVKRGALVGLRDSNGKPCGVTVADGTTLSKQQRRELDSLRKQFLGTPAPNSDGFFVARGGRTRRFSFEWQADEESFHCTRCNNTFTFILRKHHCRRCGSLCCFACSSHFFLAKKDLGDKDEEHRICDPCFNILSTVMTTQKESSIKLNEPKPLDITPAGDVVELAFACSELPRMKHLNPVVSVWYRFSQQENWNMFDSTQIFPNEQNPVWDETMAIAAPILFGAVREYVETAEFKFVVSSADFTGSVTNAKVLGESRSILVTEMLDADADGKFLPQWKLSRLPLIPLVGSVPANSSIFQRRGSTTTQAKVRIRARMVRDIANFQYEFMASCENLPQLKRRPLNPMLGFFNRKNDFLWHSNVVEDDPNPKFPKRVVIKPASHGWILKVVVLYVRDPKAKKALAEWQVSSVEFDLRDVERDCLNVGHFDVLFKDIPEFARANALLRLQFAPPEEPKNPAQLPSSTSSASSTGLSMTRRFSSFLASKQKKK